MQWKYTLSILLIEEKGKVDKSNKKYKLMYIQLYFFAYGNNTIISLISIQHLSEPIIWNKTVVKST